MPDKFEPYTNIILACAPDDTVVTDYDRAHFLTYARLLDAADSGACWREAAHEILGCEWQNDYQAARQCWDSHLARARWIVGDGLALVVRTSLEGNETATKY